MLSSAVVTTETHGAGSKRLEIRCNCGERATFRGDNTEAIMAAIDNSGWSDSPGGGPGWVPGHCAKCNREGWEE